MWVGRPPITIHIDINRCLLIAPLYLWKLLKNERASEISNDVSGRLQSKKVVARGDSVQNFFLDCHAIVIASHRCGRLAKIASR